MRVILTVLDALGIGRGNNKGTLNKLLMFNPNIDFSFFERNQIVQKDLINTTYRGKNLYKTYLESKNPIPDSYLGHSEIIGQHVSVKPVFLENVKEQLLKELRAYGDPEYHDGIIEVKNHFVVGNNGECQPGLNLNILWLNKPNIHEDEMDKLGRKILNVSRCTRVIQMWGNRLNIKQVMRLGVITRKIDDESRQYLCIPPLNIYNKAYKVKHYGVKMSSRNLLDILGKNEVNEYFIGKVGKMFLLPKNVSHANYTGTDTDMTFKTLFNELDKVKEGLFFVNVQNIDLAGHEQNFDKATRVLLKMNENIPKLVDQLHDDDILILTADHGNDSLSGDTFHTFEDVPLIVIAKRKMIFRRSFGSCFGDIAASILNMYKLGLPEEGKVLFQRGD